MEDQINKKAGATFHTRPRAIKVDNGMPWFPLIINLTQKTIEDSKYI